MKSSSYLNTVIVMAALLFSTSAMAQFSIGGRAGINIASYSWEEAVTDNDDLNTSSAISPHVGFVAIWETSDIFHLQAELNYIQKGGKTSIELDQATGTDANGQQVTVQNYERDYKISAHYLEIPVLAKLRLGGESFAANIMVGPSLGVALSAREKIDLEYTQVGNNNNNQEFSDSDTEKIDIDKDGNRIDFGLNFGAGMEIAAGSGKILFDLRYQLGLANVLEDGDDPDERRKNRGFQIGVGYVIPL